MSTHGTLTVPLPPTRIYGRNGLYRKGRIELTRTDTETTVKVFVGTGIGFPALEITAPTSDISALLVALQAGTV